MKINRYKSEDELLVAFADFFIATAQKFISENGAFNVVLSGGNSPRKLYELLASSVFYGKLDWTKLYFFFGDERCVPAKDPANNAWMVQQTLFDPLHISSAQIFKINTDLSPESAAAQYMDDISNHFSGRKPSFDLIILGLGDNAHTASLFPFHELLTETQATVKEVFLKDENRYRISMTAPLINLASTISFLVYGANKAEAVHQVLEYETDVQKYPAQLIHPEQGEIQWFLDDAAASRLKK